MTKPVAVIDTNVVVSGLISQQTDSPPCYILDEMLSGEVSFLLSLDLLTEYRHVLLRPKMKKLHHLTEDEIDGILTAISVNGQVRYPPRSPNHGPDPGDQHIWDLMDSYPDAVLVTGDMALQKFKNTKGIVLSPKEFVAHLKGAHPNRLGYL
ncbi:putative toxin-antitoxin system toxin component, PIN family [Nitrospira sp. M1]